MEILQNYRFMLCVHTNVHTHSACDYGCCFFVLAPFGLTGGIHLKLLYLRWPQEQPIIVLYKNINIYIYIFDSQTKKKSLFFLPAFIVFFSRVGTTIYKCVYHLSIPGTVMTSIIEGQSPKTKPFPTKTKVKGHLGSKVFI